MGISPKIDKYGRVRGCSSRGQVRSHIAVTGQGQEGLKQRPSHLQEFAKECLFDAMDRLMLFGGGVEAFHEGPEDREGLIGGAGAAGPLGGGEGRELDGRCGGGEHGCGSSSMRESLGRR
jgi:hypothetical protein